MKAEKIIKKIKALEAKGKKSRPVNIEERKKLRKLLRSTLKFKMDGTVEIGQWVVKALRKTNNREERIQIYSKKSWDKRGSSQKKFNRVFFVKPKSIGS